MSESLTAALIDYMADGKRPDVPSFNEYVDRYDGGVLSWEGQQEVINSLPNFQRDPHDRIDQHFSTPEVSPDMRKIFLARSTRNKVTETKS